MTDLLSEAGFEPTPIEDLLSPTETVPTPGDVRPAREVATCSECDETFRGPARNYNLRKHVEKVHPTKADAKPAPAKKAPAKKAPAKPRPTMRRPLGETLGRLVLQAGRFINAAVDAPTGAAIMFEAGAAGEAIDRVIAGTMIDRPLQKGAQVAERFEPLVPLVTLPVMTFMLSRNPMAGGMLEGELREALEEVLVQSLPLLRKRTQRTRATVDALTELKQLDPSLAESDDPIGLILQSFFQPASPPDSPAPDAE